MKTAALFFGARANYSRMRALVAQIDEHHLPIYLVNTGQQWDPNFIGEGMGKAKTFDLKAHTSDCNVISAKVREFLAHHPCDSVIVYGDTASALGPALAAKELGLPIMHLEAGFRTYDGRGNRIETGLPEEAIRVAVDQMAAINVPLIDSTYRELLKEKQQGMIPGHIVEPVGHPIIDYVLARIDQYDQIEPDNRRGVLTIHRRANTLGGRESGVAKILQQLAIGQAQYIRWTFPAHPGVRQLIAELHLTIPSNVEMLDTSLGHDEMLMTIAHSGIVMTDSNGIQLEAALIGRRSIVPRPELCFVDLVDTCTLATPDTIGYAIESMLSTAAPSRAEVLLLRNRLHNGNSTRNMLKVVSDWLADEASVGAKAAAEVIG